MSRGKFIVLEGTDGAGKATQVSSLKKKAGKDGIILEIFSFPVYDTFTGRAIKEYLSGGFGDPVSIHPKLASIPYVINRFGAKQKIEFFLSKGIHILGDRYYGSNLAHQDVARLDRGTDPHDPAVV